MCCSWTSLRWYLHLSYQDPWPPKQQHPCGHGRQARNKRRHHVGINTRRTAKLWQDRLHVVNSAVGVSETLTPIRSGCSTPLEPEEELCTLLTKRIYIEMWQTANNMSLRGPCTSMSPTHCTRGHVNPSVNYTLSCPRKDAPCHHRMSQFVAIALKHRTLPPVDRLHSVQHLL